MSNPSASHPAQYQAPEKLLHDKIIMVTGAGDGIGYVAAKTFARHGATVILLGRTEEKLNETYDEIVAAGWPQPAIVPLNLATITPHDLAQLADMLADEFGRLDGLLNNASILGPITPLENYPEDEFANVMQVNLTGTFYLTKAMMPLLRQSPSASLVFTTSSVGRKGRAYWGAYAISKFATEGMMQVFADELENTSSIRVNCINPGGTRTRMRAQAYPGEDPMTLPTAEDIMPAYLYLMGDDSKDIHGQSLDAQIK